MSRMKERSVNHGGKYVSVHLRFEEVSILIILLLLLFVAENMILQTCLLSSHAQDMVAFSCCVCDGGEQEEKNMIAARERGWKGKFTKPGRTICPGAIRLNGKCPLTPLEVMNHYYTTPSH